MGSKPTWVFLAEERVNRRADRIMKQAFEKVYSTAKITHKPIGHIAQKRQKDGTTYNKIEFVYD